MSGMQTDLARMKSTAADAVRIGEELKGAVQQLDAKLAALGTMNGQIKNAFWMGHSNHLDAVTKLCARLHTMSDGINTGRARYETQDSESHAAFNQLGGASGMDLGALGKSV